MNVSQMNNLRKKSFSPLTVFKSYHRDRLQEAIRLNPVVFIELVTRFGLRPQPELELMSFFLDLAIVNGHIVEDYRPHLEMLLANLTYTWLWPTSVALFRTSLAKFGVNFVDPASYY